MKHFYEFGPFRVDPTKRLLMRNGEPQPLTPKAFDILLVLLRDGGQVIEKDELMRAVWPDTVVEENNLTRNISAVAENQFERAIQLFEGAATQREVLNIQPSASEQEQSDRNKALAGSMLEDEAFASACEQGHAMTLEQAIAFASM